MSEVSDALVVVVSEETGDVSIAQGGRLNRGIAPGELIEQFEAIQNKKPLSRRLFIKGKGRQDDEKNS